MALQHFYSRVPARVSMFNKADGFDTFAMSAELEREFVEREMASVYENKLGKNDVSSVRQGKMPCIYTQLSTRSGAFLQNCISYIPLDYTGERSAYLSHTLVYSEEEKSRILSSASDSTLNPDIFVKDIAPFGITDAEAAANGDYPPMEYSPRASKEGGYILRELNEDTVKSFLFAILNAVCGKGRNVCFKLFGEDKDLSLLSLQIFNEVLSILPYHIRDGVSFSSYITDIAQYANYKLRGVSSEFSENSPKCVFLDLQTDHIVGLNQPELVANKALIEFFYSLIENEALRREFLAFTDRATKAIPSLSNTNLKALSSIVFIFQCTSGLYSEDEVLPDDAAIYEYLNAYEKYRDALNTENRIKGYSCISRYAKGHLPIPRNIFSKISRLYGSEDVSVKRIVMNTVLELIHTDVMRDKLFTFIKTNYAGETAEMKKTIVRDLCRVFYGGFLQNQLLVFFSDIFVSETEEARSLILDKLLLSIRTPSVQGKILEFLHQHYGIFNEEQKDGLYGTFFAMIPEGDGLAKGLVALVNANIGAETDERRASVSQGLGSLLEADYKKREHLLMPALVYTEGFCRDKVIALAFGPWQTRKLSEEYIDLLSNSPVKEKVDVLSRASLLVSGEDAAAIGKKAVVMFSSSAAGGLYTWLDAEERLSPLPFGGEVISAAILPKIAEHMLEAFGAEQGLDGVMRVNAAAERYGALKACEGYAVISAYESAVNAAISGDPTALSTALSVLDGQEDLKPDMAKHLKANHLDSDYGELSLIRLNIVYSVLSTGRAGLDGIYRRLSAVGHEEAMEKLLSVASEMAEGGEFAKGVIVGGGSGLAAAVSAFIEGRGKGAHHWLSSHIQGGTALGEAVEAAVKAHKKEKGTIFSRIFHIGIKK